MTSKVKIAVLVLFLPFTLLGLLMAAIGWSISRGFDITANWLEKFK